MWTGLDWRSESTMDEEDDGFSRKDSRREMLGCSSSFAGNMRYVVVVALGWMGVRFQWEVGTRHGVIETCGYS